MYTFTAYYFDYLMIDFKHAQIWQLKAEIVSIDLICLNAHCHVKSCADLRIEFLRLSSIKKCLHMLKLDHRGLKLIKSFKLKLIKSDLVNYQIAFSNDIIF